MNGNWRKRFQCQGQSLVRIDSARILQKDLLLIDQDANRRTPIISSNCLDIINRFPYLK